MNGTGPTWTATKRSIVNDVKLAMDDLNMDLEEAAETVVTDSDFVPDGQQDQMKREVVEEIRA